MFSFFKQFSVSKKELALFSRQLAALLSSGVPILKALDVYLEQTDNKYLRAVVTQIREQVKNGHSFSASIAAYPKVFSPFYRALIKSGENSGSLDQSLSLVAGYFSQEIRLSSEIKSALAYPLFILGAGFITVLFIFIHVMPQIVPLFQGLGIEKPLATRILIAISSFLQANWIWLFLAFLILFLIFRRALKNDTFSYYFSGFKLSFPMAGALLFKSDIARFSRALGIALSKGVPVIAAVESVTPVLSQYRLRKSLEIGRKQLTFGKSIKDVFLEAKVFSPFVLRLVSTGQESGKLAKAFFDIAETYESDCQEMLRTFTNLLEPAMVLLVGLFVGFIVAAVLVPVLDLSFVGI